MQSKAKPANLGKGKASSTKGKSNAYEYAFEPVPLDKRRSLWSIFSVLTGFALALTNFVTGGVISVGLTFKEGLLAILIGNLILIAIVITTGIMSHDHGLSSTFLSRKIFGKKGSAIFSLMITLNSATWVAINGDMFARLISATFPGWPIPVAITSVLVIFLWLDSAIRGYKGLEIISTLGVPAAIIFSAVGVIGAGVKTGGYGHLVTYVPKNPITFASAISAIVGAWIFGAVKTPDVCRYTQKRSHVVISGFGAFIIGCIGLQVAGSVLALTTGSGDFVESMSSLGLIKIAFVGATFLLWTTQNNNIYGGSLALQNVIKETKFAGKITHKAISTGIAVAASILGIFGIYSYILPIVQTFSVLVVPIPALMIAEMLFVKNSKENIDINPISLITWAVGIGVGYWSLNNQVFIPALVSMAVSIVLYTGLSKLFDGKFLGEDCKEAIQ